MSEITIYTKTYLTVSGYAEKHEVSRQRVWKLVNEDRFYGILRVPNILIPADAEYPEDMRVTVA